MPIFLVRPRFRRVEPVDVDAVDQDFAAARLFQHIDQTDQGALPAPLQPISPKISPCATSRLMLRKAEKSACLWYRFFQCF